MRHLWHLYRAWLYSCLCCTRIDGGHSWITPVATPQRPSLDVQPRPSPGFGPRRVAVVLIGHSSSPPDHFRLPSVRPDPPAMLQTASRGMSRIFTLRTRLPRSSFIDRPTLAPDSPSAKPDSQRAYKGIICLWALTCRLPQNAHTRRSSSSALRLLRRVRCLTLYNCLLRDHAMRPLWLPALPAKTTTSTHERRPAWKRRPPTVAEVLTHLKSV